MRKKTPTSEVDEYIIHLNNELRGIIVKKKMKKIKNIKKYNDLGRLCAQVADLVQLSPLRKGWRPELPTYP